MAYYQYPYIPRNQNSWYNNGASYMREMPMPPMPGPQPPPVCPQPEVDYYTYPKNLDAALNLIEEAVMGEHEDQKFYECLINMAPAEDKPIIESIRMDEAKHNQLFRTIYCEMTGQVLPAAPEVEVECPKDYCEGIREAIFGELAAVERYRRILYAMQNRRHINMVVETITDEQKHAAKMNYLYSKNCACKCPPEPPKPPKPEPPKPPKPEPPKHQPEPPKPPKPHK